MSFIRELAGPSFVERPAAKTPDELERDRTAKERRREGFWDGAQALFWLSLVGLCGALLLAIGGFSPLAFGALALILAISAISTLAQ